PSYRRRWHETRIGQLALSRSLHGDRRTITSAMPDILTKAERSRRMALVRGSGNETTELRLARLFRRAGITGWRRGVRLPGRPDFTFRAQRIVVFVDGCFWHGCPIHYSKPATHPEFWRQKLKDNRARDRRVDAKLRAEGWRVVRIWEHELKKRSLPCLEEHLRT